MTINMHFLITNSHIDLSIDIYEFIYNESRHYFFLFIRTITSGIFKEKLCTFHLQKSYDVILLTMSNLLKSIL